MSRLKIFTSNRLEVLSQRLANTVREPVLAPLKPEVIIVQSRGMERWISMELAAHNGVSANCKFPFPNVFLEDVFKRIIPNLPDESVFEPGVLTFRIMKILPRLLSRPEFKNLKTYLSDDTNKLKLYQLSSKIADVFDQYLVFRPEMIFDWEAGKGDDRDENRWQAYLWRELTRGAGMPHRARLRKDLFDGIANRSISTDDLPPRVSVFGISYLPPFHLQVFAAISRLIQVNLFILNPCKEYWFDIASDREIRKIEKHYATKKMTAENLHLERGNRLLASMGNLGRDFMSLLAEFNSDVYEQFEDLDCDTMLACVQSDILSLWERGQSGNQDPRFISSSNISIDVKQMKGENREATPVSQRLTQSDTSIQFHSCHSPLREMEVLYDNLLAMFEEDPALLPRDIIVMTPDIELYAPYVHIVFDTPEDEALRIPYSIADQNIKKESRLTAGFLSFLDLKASRFGAAQILNLLELPGVKEKFGLTASDVHRIEGWIRDTNIRWGIDADSRRQLGLPGFSQNTWAAGIKRLLLGYAMPGNDRELFNGILPYDNLEGAGVQVLGKFLEFLDQILLLRKKFEKPRSLNEWHSTFWSAINQLFRQDDENEPEIQSLRRAIDELAQKENLAGYHEAVELEVIRAHLEELLEHRSFGYGFLRGGVTFCAMLPMRSIPFKVACLVGLNSDAFPRNSRPLGFDLIAKYPRKGDRSRRNDDKYLFLESIVSARKKLYISYVGQSIQDNARIPPSTLVSELLDLLEEGFGLTQDQLITRHRLQAFNSEYFQKDSNLFSYSRENLEATTRLFERIHPRPFISAGLTLPSEEWKHVTLDQLCEFYANTARYLLRQRLGIFISENEVVLAERENFSLDSLLTYAIGQDLLAKRLAGSKVEDDLSIQMAKAVLPHGNVGRYLFDELSSAADGFIRKMQKYTQGETADDIDVELEINGFHISGKLTGFYPQGLVRFRYAKKKIKDLLMSWILHLVLCNLENQQHAPRTTFLGKDGVWEFQPIAAGQEILRQLLHFYWQGLIRPLPLFPESSYEFAHQMLVKKKSKLAAVKAAGLKLLGNDFQRGEIEDPYFKLCFKYMNPLDKDFEKLALEIFSLLLSHCREVV